MIVEQLIVTTQEDGSSHSSPFVSKSDALCEPSMIEENALYYSTGCVVENFCSAIRRTTEKMQVIAKALLNMPGINHPDIEPFSSYLSYVKIWIDTTDRAGLKHASKDTLWCFKALELVTYELLKKGATKTGVIIQVENDQFYRDLIMNEFTSEVSTILLHDVVNNYVYGSPSEVLLLPVVCLSSTKVQHEG